MARAVGPFIFGSGRLSGHISLSPIAKMYPVTPPSFQRQMGITAHHHPIPDLRLIGQEGPHRVTATTSGLAG